ASIELSTDRFSPVAATLAITARTDNAVRFGIRLSDVRGHPLGWLAPPAKRQEAEVFWDGTLDGRRVRDGYYQAEVGGSGRVAAAAGFHLDSTPARLASLSVKNGSTPFYGDGPLLTTLSPGADGDRSSAALYFRLTEFASVTLNVQRSGPAQAETIYTRTW